MIIHIAIGFIFGASFVGLLFLLVKYNPFKRADIKRSFAHLSDNPLIDLEPSVEKKRRTHHNAEENAVKKDLEKWKKNNDHEIRRTHP